MVSPCDASLLSAPYTDLELAIEQALSAKYCRLPTSLIRQIHDPAQCPAHLLNWLAFHHSVDVWDETWPEVTKRNAIQASLELHRHKGTRGAVANYLQSMGIQATVEEWFDQVPTASPGTCRITINIQDLADSGVRLFQVHDVVRKSKRLSIHCSSRLVWEIASRTSNATVAFGFLQHRYVQLLSESSSVMSGVAFGFIKQGRA